MSIRVLITAFLATSLVFMSLFVYGFFESTNGETGLSISPLYVDGEVVLIKLKEEQDSWQEKLR